MTHRIEFVAVRSTRKAGNNTQTHTISTDNWPCNKKFAEIARGVVFQDVETSGCD